MASSSAAWLGELLIERLPWVAGDMLAEVQVIGHSVTRQRRSAGSPQLDQQTFWPLHGHHHWRSSGPLSRDGPEAEPQARPVVPAPAFAGMALELALLDIPLPVCATTRSVVLGILSLAKVFALIDKRGEASDQDLFEFKFKS